MKDIWWTILLVAGLIWWNIFGLFHMMIVCVSVCVTFSLPVSSSADTRVSLVSVFHLIPDLHEFKDSHLKFRESIIITLGKLGTNRVYCNILGNSLVNDWNANILTSSPRRVPRSTSSSSFGCVSMHEITLVFSSRTVIIKLKIQGAHRKLEFMISCLDVWLSFGPKPNL